MAQREYPRQPRRPIRRVAPAPATRGSLALSDPVIANNPYQSGAQIYPTGSTNPGNTALLMRNPNPPIDEVSATTPPLKNYGATGTSFFGGIIQSDEYNPEFGWRDAVIKYEQMSRNEAQVMAIKQQYEMPILSANWKIEPASDSPIDQEIASFVQSCLFEDMCYTTSDGTEIYQSWQETLRQILMYKWYGFMLLEKCFRIDDGWVKWSRFLPLLPRTVWRWYVGADNELESVEQWAYKEWTYQYNRIPRGKLIHFANRQEGQNYQGVSVLRAAFKNWWYKQQFEKIAAIEIERNAIIPPVVKMGEHPSADEVNAALKLAQNVRANELMGVVIGHDMSFDYPRMTERGAAQIMPLIEYHDTMMARAILAQFLNLGSHEVGSYALAQTQYTNFLNAAQGDCQYVCDVLNHQAIRQLVDYNYDGVAVYPKLTCSRLVSQDITTLSNALQYLATYVPPSPEVNDAIADALGLPKPPASMVEATNPTSPTTLERPENGRANDHSSDEGKQVQGHSSGTGGGKDGTADYQDNYDNGGAGDGVGMSEYDEPQALREFRLLRESLDAFNAQVSADDAVERGLTYLFAGGGNPNHIPKGEPGAGQFAPGGAGGHGGEHEGHSGGGRGRGGSGGGGSGGSEHEGHSRSSGGSHASKGEHAPKAPKASKASSSRSRGGGKGEGEPKGQKAGGAHHVEKGLEGHPMSPEEARGWFGSHGNQFNTTEALNPWMSRRVYGDHELRASLEREPIGRLREAAGVVHERLASQGVHVNITGRTKAELVSQIHEAVIAHPQEPFHAPKPSTHATHEATHATHAAKSSARSSSSTRGKASGKSEEEKTAAKTVRSEKAKAQRLETARQRRDAAEERAHTAAKNAGEQLQYSGHRSEVEYGRLHNENLTARQELAKANQSLARLEGRKLAPEEANYTREEWARKVAEGSVTAPKGSTRSSGKGKSTETTKSSSSRSRTQETRAALVPVHPVAPGSLDITSTAALKPYALAHVFGMHQLRQALEAYPHGKLLEGVHEVQRHYPGTKPTRMNSKKALLDYIVEHVGRNPHLGDKNL